MEAGNQGPGTAETGTGTTCKPLMVQGLAAGAGHEAPRQETSDLDHVPGTKQWGQEGSTPLWSDLLHFPPGPRGEMVQVVSDDGLPFAWVL